MTTIRFPKFSGIRCLMMPYIQGDPHSVPEEYGPYADVIAGVCLRRGEVGYLTIDESIAPAGQPHRGARAKYGRALHTEAGLYPYGYKWGSGPTWGGHPRVRLDYGVRILLANSLDDTCAIWDAQHADTTDDGDIGHLAHLYPYKSSTLMQACEVREIGILTPHESLPVHQTVARQFLRIVGAGVHGREDYFTTNHLVSHES